MNANSMCISCMLTKQEKLIRDFPDEEKKSAYMHEVLRLLYERGQTESAPALYETLDGMLFEAFGTAADYTEIKKKFNALLLSREDALTQRIRRSADPIEACIRYVCAANYIDFAALGNVEESTFAGLLDKAEAQTVPADEYARFLADLDSARTLVYLTDNCGEIVLDKIFIKILKERYPSLSITAIVRGGAVINDATMEDAREVGLTDVVPCIGNGTRAPGTVLNRLSEEAKACLDRADVIISKGQGNFESLYGEGLHPYFLFLCKCELFVRRFGLAKYESVFVREDRIHIKNT